MSYSSSILSWYEAYQRCKDDGQDLLQNANETIVKKYEDGRTYWVSFVINNDNAETQAT
jgi:hypothetical protein